MPFAVLRLFWRSIKEPGYRQDIVERFGAYRGSNPGRVIWIHAVSAGETVAAVPLIKRLIEAGYPCVVTNMTPTGRERVQVLLGDQVENCYAPYDLPGAVDRFLERNNPRLLLTIDTELWPNTLAACERRGIPAAIVNGRMSLRSAIGYERFSLLARPMIESLDLVAVQTQAHAERFVNLGARSGCVNVTGSIKFDGEYAGDHAARLEAARALSAGRPVLLAASTHEGEEEALLNLLDALKAVLPGVLLVLAPRHTHRADHVARLCEQQHFSVHGFSQGTVLPAGIDVLLLDVMGELESWFPIARVAFIGGSLVPVGGHNLLEAVRAGTAVIMGPHLYNIDDIAQQFIDHDGMIVVHNDASLRDEVLGLMRDEGRVRRLVSAADAVLMQNRGALDRTVMLVKTLLADKD